MCKLLDTITQILWILHKVILNKLLILKYFFNKSDVHNCALCKSYLSRNNFKTKHLSNVLGS